MVKKAKYEKVCSLSRSRAYTGQKAWYNFNQQRTERKRGCADVMEANRANVTKFEAGKITLASLLRYVFRLNRAELRWIVLSMVILALVSVAPSKSSLLKLMRR